MHSRAERNIFLWVVKYNYFNDIHFMVISVETLAAKQYSTASLHKLAAGRKLATTHLNVSNRQMCGCTGFKSGSYNKSYYNRPFRNDTGL